MNAAPIDRNANTAVYKRPEWMSDSQWQQVSADLTEHWMTLLEAAARSLGREAFERRAAGH